MKIGSSGHLGAVVLTACLLVGSRTAQAENEWKTLAWSAPTFFAYGGLHEYSHLLGAKLVGARTARIVWLPTKGVFGAVTWDKEDATTLGGGGYEFMSFAPILTDVALLAAYGLLYEVDSVRSNEHAFIPMTTMAGWALSDFGFQALPFLPRKDHVENVYEYFKLSQWQRLPFRVLHVAGAVLAGHLVWRGFDKINGEETVTNQQAIRFRFEI